MAGIGIFMVRIVETLLNLTLTNTMIIDNVIMILYLMLV